VTCRRSGGGAACAHIHEPADGATLITWSREAGEVRGPDGIADAARRELPDLPFGAGQYMQAAVDVDDPDRDRTDRGPGGSLR
jgi:hypothetical protein